ncbi:hypothetical protein MMC08_008442 [Hypocenomyce scalaris]|nr:hypothetical protein [Hypocenomyce scalaris]
MAFSIWCESADITCHTYTTLLEVFSLLINIRQLKDLLFKLDTLKHCYCQQLSLMQLHKSPVHVDAEVQPTLAESAKFICVTDTQDLVFFDLVNLVSTMISSSDFLGKQHQELAVLSDELTEIFESVSWASSIHSTSGDFGQYKDGEPIFSSDFVQFRVRPVHLRRVIAVYRDHRTVTAIKDEIVIIVQKILNEENILTAQSHLLKHTTPSNDEIHSEANELFLIKNYHSLIHERDVLSQHDSIYLNWLYDSTNSNSHTSSMVDKDFFIRRVLNYTADQVRSLNLSANI